MDVTPKKVVGCNLSCLLCSKSIEKRERIRVFGKSSVNIADLICCALEVDFNTFVNPVEIYICTKCYKRLIRFEKARNNLKELKDEIKRNYQGNDHIRTKRLHTSPDKVEQKPSKKRFNSASNSVAKSLRFSDNDQTLIAPTTTIIPTIETGEVISALPKITGSSTVLLSTFQTSPVPVSTSTPATSTFTKPNTRGSKIKITVEYPSKTLNTVPATELEPLCKAIIHGPASRIAKAALKCKLLTAEIIAQVLNIVSSEVSGLCSKKKPSLLRNNKKEELANYRMQSICEEWEKRAPVFFSFLRASCISKSTKDAKWLPSIVVAGSVLLKQRNNHMSATAAVLGILAKTRTIEVQ